MIIVGIDEVGRGCWAGPLVAGAVILPYEIKGLKDSKRLQRNARNKYADVITKIADGYGLGWVWPTEIDELGLTKSVCLAMHRAVEAISVPYDEIIIDGNYNFLSDIPHTKAIIKADDSINVVSAASIIAKVARDNYMFTIAETYNQYGFEAHVGYGTALHLERLKKYGVSAIHRKTFKPIKELLYVL